MKLLLYQQNKPLEQREERPLTGEVVEKSAEDQQNEGRTSTNVSSVTPKWVKKFATKG